MSVSPDLPEPLGEAEEVDAIALPDREPQRGTGLQAVLGQGLSELRTAPAVQAAAVAAGGIVAGAAVVGLARHRQIGALAPRRRLRRQGRGERVQVVASRSLLVDLHLLGSTGRGR